jgi:hypothetical protein
MRLNIVPSETYTSGRGGRVVTQDGRVAPCSSTGRVRNAWITGLMCGCRLGGPTVRYRYGYSMSSAG